LRNFEFKSINVFQIDTIKNLPMAQATTLLTSLEQLFASAPKAAPQPSVQTPEAPRPAVPNQPAAAHNHPK
jgi:hypothetical protein